MRTRRPVIRPAPEPLAITHDNAVYLATRHKGTRHHPRQICSLPTRRHYPCQRRRARTACKCASSALVTTCVNTVGVYTTRQTCRICTRNHHALPYASSARTSNPQLTHSPAPPTTTPSRRHHTRHHPHRNTSPATTPAMHTPSARASKCVVRVHWQPTHSDAVMRQVPMQLYICVMPKFPVFGNRYMLQGKKVYRTPALLQIHFSNNHTFLANRTCPTPRSDDKVR
jgi:hypothetical protein